MVRERALTVSVCSLRWEHTPQWSITSKLLISKHQQVQLLEAASVLMTITNSTTAAETDTMDTVDTVDTVDMVDATTPPDSARDFVSDRDSASPPASAYSDQPDGGSSADTTPPPQLDGMHAAAASYRTISKRYSNGSSFSRSYQSAPSGIALAVSAANGSSFGHHRQLSQEHRPTSSGSDVAAAMELLSTSFGSSASGGVGVGTGAGNNRTVHLPPDAPPVPPVPAQYLDQTALSSTSFIGGFPNQAPESFTRGELRRDDIRMEGSGESSMGDDDDDMISRARSEEDDDGIFGRMEE